MEECQAIVQRWQKEGLSEKERDDFVLEASALLTDKNQVKGYENDIANSARLAKEVDDEFIRQEVILAGLVFWFVPIIILYAQWRDLRVVNHDLLSMAFN